MLRYLINLLLIFLSLKFLLPIQDFKNIQIKLLILLAILFLVNIIIDFIRRIQKNEERQYYQNKKIKELDKKIKNLEQGELILSAIIQTLPIEIFIIDREKNIIMGKQSNKPMPQSKNIIETLRHPEIAQIINQSIQQNTSNELKQIQEFSKFHGHKRYFDFYITPTSNNLYFVCYTIDKTEKTVDKHLFEEFLNQFAHELRTPLTILTNYLQQLKEIFKQHEALIHDQEANVLLKNFNDELKKPILLFENLIFLNNINSSNKNNFETFNLNELIEICLFEFQQQSTQAIVFNSNEIIQMQGNPFLFEIAIYNLIENAIKYGPIDNQIVVSLNIIASNAEKVASTHLELRVSDRGIGILKEDLAHVFTPFYRSQNALQLKGHGLGLSIVKKIIELHRGSIRAEVNSPCGACFIATFNSNFNYKTVS